VRRHLEPDGLFIFDVWNGLAVLADPPGERQISVSDGATRITRKTRAALDIPRHLCRVSFDLARTDGGGRIEEWQEEHLTRYHFPDELKRALGQNRLELLHLRSFPDDEKPPDERAWHIVGAARARESPVPA
jgi:hypothetical protein